MNDATAARERFGTSAFTKQIFTPEIHARAFWDYLSESFGVSVPNTS